jgi:hypothetical protein
MTNEAKNALILLQAIRDSEIEYSPIWKVSHEIFTKKASEILGVPTDRISVNRNIMMGNDFGTLSVIVYLETDEERQYYRIHNGATRYKKLPSNIYEFERVLREKSLNKMYEVR